MGKSEIECDDIMGHSGKDKFSIPDCRHCIESRYCALPQRERFRQPIADVKLCDFFSMIQVDQIQK